MNENKFISSRAKSVELSTIRKFFNSVSAVPGAISLTLGQPDFPTPEYIKDAGINAIRDNKTVYTHNQGNFELRCEISKYLIKKHGINYDPETEIIVTTGASEAIDTTLRAIINEGDEVLIPSPGFVAYGACTKLSGGVPVYVPLKMEEKFHLTPDILKDYISKKTKVLILSYPNNPTGAVMGIDELRKISDIIIKNDILVISDEVYSEIIYGKKSSSITEIEGMKDRTILIGGFSKTYSMTGWRIGFTAAPGWITKHLVKIHQYNVTCAASMCQEAAFAALRGTDESVFEMVAEYNKRRIYCIERLKNMGLELYEPEGAFYIFPSIKKYNITSDEFCSKLLYDKKLAVVPGSAFGDFGEGFIRISYAYSLDKLAEGLNRLESFINTIDAR